MSRSRSGSRSTSPSRNTRTRRKSTSDPSPENDSPTPENSDTLTVQDDTVDGDVATRDDSATPQVRKSRRDSDPPVVTSVDPTVATPDPDADLVPLDFSAHQAAVRKGDLDLASQVFRYLWADSPNPDKAVWGASVREWVEGVLNDPDAVLHVSANPSFFIYLVRGARQAIRELGAPSGFNDAWLLSLLSGLDRDKVTAAEFAEQLFRTDWDAPYIINKPLRDWIRQYLSVQRLNTAEGGLAARFLNLLWNDYDHKTICDLIAEGIDTAQPSYYGLQGMPGYEGTYSGNVMPLEHVLGNYLRLASLPSLAPDGGNLDTELMALGAKVPGGDKLDPAVLRQQGVAKVEGAKTILDALAKKGSAKILTSFEAVENSDLITAFKAKAGTIWGFESVRIPYVMAAHATADGRQPVRMWELWETVRVALSQGDYKELLANPDVAIPKIVKKGVEKTQEKYDQRPADYLWWKLPDFEAAFREQCTQYLRSVAEQVPRTKFDTEGKRGSDFDSHIGALGCLAGLYWAQKVGAPVYYCLDGVKDQDIIGYKEFRTRHINTFLGGDGKEFVETITLAEIREILKNWTRLRGTVRFTRLGAFLPESEILGLVTKMEDANAPAWQTRKPPNDMSGFKATVGRLDPTLLVSLSGKPYEVMRIATQANMLQMAATAESDRVLAAFLESKGCRVLFANGLLPEGLDKSYRALVDERNPEERKLLGSTLIKALSSSTDAKALRVNDGLRDSLVKAITLHSGAA